MKPEIVAHFREARRSETRAVELMDFVYSLVSSVRDFVYFSDETYKIPTTLSENSFQIKRNDDGDYTIQLNPDLKFDYYSDNKEAREKEVVFKLGVLLNNLIGTYLGNPCFATASISPNPAERLTLKQVTTKLYDAFATTKGTACYHNRIDSSKDTDSDSESDGGAYYPSCGR